MAPQPEAGAQLLTRGLDQLHGPLPGPTPFQRLGAPASRSILRESKQAKGVQKTRLLVGGLCSFDELQRGQKTGRKICPLPAQSALFKDPGAPPKLSVGKN